MCKLGETAGSISSKLTLPKLHLATLKKFGSCDLIRSRKWMNIWKIAKYTQLFVLWAMHFGKRTLKQDRVKWLESKVLNCCPKITMAGLCKIGLKGNYIPENLAPPSEGPSSLSTTPSTPPPLHLWCIFFALLAMNGPLPAELKFRENTAHVVWASWD